MSLVSEPRRDYFKDWAIPGPRPVGFGESDLSDLVSDSVSEGVSLDALSGHFRIFQLKNGHRYSTDDVLTAWYASISAPAPRKILDLGSGIGTVALFLAWKFAGAHVTTVEAQAESYELAKRSVAFNGLSDRVTLRHEDFRESVWDTYGPFDLITGTPPYFAVGAGSAGNHPQKNACRFETRGTIADYAITAAKLLAPGGVFVCVFPDDPEFQRGRALTAAREADLVVVRSRAVVLKEGNAPLLKLFMMMKTSDLPGDYVQRSWSEPDLMIRQHDGRVSSEYLAIKLSMGLPPTE